MEPAAQGVPGYFVWQAPGQPVVIHLSVDVVDRMGADILRGFAAVPKRGAEVGGVLIGTVTQSGAPAKTRTVRIEDFEAVPCTYARGPSYLLTAAERTYFDEVCQRRSTKVVGFYRSHTREGLTLQPEDLQLLDRSFPPIAQVVLLVKPFATKPGVAGFFVRENGQFPAATPLEFPFRRREMTGEEPPPRPPMEERKRKKGEPAPSPSEGREESTAAAPAPYYRIFSAEPKEPSEDPPKEPQGPKSRTGVWLVASFLFLLLGVVLGYEASRLNAPRRASDFALSLGVERTGGNLTVHWNPDAKAVLSADNGVLEIEDAGETKRVELDRANLSSGSFVYATTSDKVRFRLVVSLGSGLSVTEALGWSR
jgi:hypothetical protein